MLLSKRNPSVRRFEAEGEYLGRRRHCLQGDSVEMYETYETLAANVAVRTWKWEAPVPRLVRD